MKNLPLVLLVAAGCAGKPALTDSFDDLAGVDEKSDAFSSRMKVLGNLTVGQTSPTVKYTSTPRYRAFSLAAKGPAELSIWVRSTDGGDAVAWLLDAKYNILAVNDDADQTTYDSHLDYTLPAGGAPYWIVLRDYDRARHSFVVTVDPLKPAPQPCAVGFGVSDEPPADVAGVEAVLNNYPGSFQAYDGSEPDCLDFASTKVRAAVAEDIRANSGIDWQDATPVVVQEIVDGAPDFVAALNTAQGEAGGYAKSGLGKAQVFTDNYPQLDANLKSVIGDTVTNPKAYFQIHLHVEAEECSQEGWVRVDRRTGAVVIVRVQGC